MAIYYGDGESVTSRQISFVSLGERGFSYEALLANIPEESTDPEEQSHRVGDDSLGNSGQTLGAQTTRKNRASASDTPSLPSNAAPPTTTPANTQPLGFATEDSSSNSHGRNNKATEDDENAERVAAATTSSNSYGQQVTTGKNTGDKTGFSWLWLLLILGGLGFGSYYFAYARRKQ